MHALSELEPHPARSDRPGRVEPSVDQRAVADPAVQAVLRVGRVGADRGARDADVGDGEGEAVAWRESEARVQRVVVFVGDDQQTDEPGMDLLGGESVRMGMKPIQPGAVLHLEAHALAATRADRFEARTVLRLGQRQSVEMHCGGLGQSVVDHRIEALAAAGPEDRLRDLARSEVGHVPATPGNRVGALHDKASHIHDGDPR